jgi:hypothetical protein
VETNKWIEFMQLLGIGTPGDEASPENTEPQAEVYETSVPLRTNIVPTQDQDGIGFSDWTDFAGALGLDIPTTQEYSDDDIIEPTGEIAVPIDEIDFTEIPAMPSGSSLQERAEREYHRTRIREELTKRDYLPGRRVTDLTPHYMRLLQLEKSGLMADYEARESQPTLRFFT